jgi:hypothetical protein
MVLAMEPLPSIGVGGLDAETDQRLSFRRGGGAGAHGGIALEI